MAQVPSAAAMVVGLSRAVPLEPRGSLLVEWHPMEHAGPGDLLSRAAWKNHCLIRFKIGMRLAEATMPARALLPFAKPF